MKNILLIFSAAILLFSCDNTVTPTKVEGKMSFYGSEISTDNSISVDKLMAKMNASDSLENITVKGEILETCAVKGCWMTVANPAGEEMRVRFKDYGFFVPTEGAGGKEATFSGKAFKDEISVDMQHHYIDDSDASDEEKVKLKAAITEPKAVVSFLANGVAIAGME